MVTITSPNVPTVLISQTRPRAFQDLHTFLDTSNGYEYTLCSKITYRLKCPNQKKKGRWELHVNQQGVEVVFKLTVDRDESVCCLLFQVEGISGYAEFSIKRDGTEVYKWCRPVKVLARNDDGETPDCWKIPKQRKSTRKKSTKNKVEKGRKSHKKKRVLKKPDAVVVHGDYPVIGQFTEDQHIAGKLTVVNEEEIVDVVDLWPERDLDYLLATHCIDNFPSPTLLAPSELRRKRVNEIDEFFPQQLKRMKTFYSNQ